MPEETRRGVTFTRVDVTPDTDEWKELRRQSVGASEAAAVLGLTTYATPLDIYLSKHGVDRTFDPLLAWTGHRSEPIIHDWVHEWSGVDVNLEPGFMARSVEYPFITATFDRVSYDPFLTWQFKTAQQFVGHQWDEGVPTGIQVQVQTEMLVAGTHRAAVVVWIGGREFRLFWVLRDERFIAEYLIPGLSEFWAGVEAGTPPDPRTVAEISSRYPSEDREVELSAEAFDVLERITVLNSDLKEQEAERDALKVVLAGYVQSADTLTFEGRKVATWKSQKGRESLDTNQLRADHPDLVAAYVRQGAPFRVLRAIKPKDSTGTTKAYFAGRNSKETK